MSSHSILTKKKTEFDHNCKMVKLPSLFVFSKFAKLISMSAIALVKCVVDHILFDFVFFFLLVIKGESALRNCRKWTTGATHIIPSAIYRFTNAKDGAGKSRTVRPRPSGFCLTFFFLVYLSLSQIISISHGRTIESLTLCLVKKKKQLMIVRLLFCLFCFFPVQFCGEPFGAHPGDPVSAPE